MKVPEFRLRRGSMSSDDGYAVDDLFNATNKKATSMIWLLTSLIIAGVFISTGGLAFFPAATIAALTLPLVGPYLLALLAVWLAVAVAVALINGINGMLNALYRSEWMNPTVKNVLKFGVVPAAIVTALLLVLFPPLIPTIISALILMGPINGSIMSAILLTGTLVLASLVVNIMHRVADFVFGREEKEIQEKLLNQLITDKTVNMIESFDTSTIRAVVIIEPHVDPITKESSTRKREIKVNNNHGGYKPTFNFNEKKLVLSSNDIDTAQEKRLQTKGPSTK